MTYSKFKATCFKDIIPQEVDWLWQPYFPLGKLSFIAGDPGVGKSFITVFLASIVSKGGKFPFSDNNTPIGNVIIQNAEDGAGDTIKKRLDIFQANHDNIYMVDLKKEHEDKIDLLLTDIEDLDNLFNELKPKLVIFDPITTFLGDIDMNSAPKVRQVLRPIGKLAKKYNCAIVFIIHRNKGIQGGNQIHRLLGSVDFSAIARSIVSVGLSKDQSESLFMHSKSNLSEKGKTIAFNLSDKGITWLGTRDYLIDDEILNQQNYKETPRDIARNFIIDYLSENGKSKYEDILASAKDYEISEKTLNRARNELKDENIVSKENIGHFVYWFLDDIYPNTH